MKVPARVFKLLRRLEHDSFLQRPLVGPGARRARRDRFVAIGCQCHRGCAGVGLCPCNLRTLAEDR